MRYGNSCFILASFCLSYHMITEVVLTRYSRLTPNLLAGKLKLAMITQSKQFWHLRHLKIRLVQRWFLVLGVLAMLGAVFVFPVTSAFAATNATSAGSMSMGDTPCHKPLKPCPECPQKSCPNMAACLVKCFQNLSALPTEVRLDRKTVSARVLPPPSLVTASSLIPPLLRPPIV